MLGYSIIDYVVSRWGKEQVFKLIKNNGNTSKVFKLSQQEFEAGYFKYIGQQYFSKASF